MNCSCAGSESIFIPRGTVYVCRVDVTCPVVFGSDFAGGQWALFIDASIATGVGRIGGIIVYHAVTESARNALIDRGLGGVCGQDRLNANEATLVITLLDAGGASVLDGIATVDRGGLGQSDA